ncbi:MAG: CD225/dispanin family protein [Weeksellaceae bacterium]
MENQNVNTGTQSTPPDNNLIWAILSTFFCCMPTGIYAIVKASEVNTKWNAGDYAGAVESADQAKKWSIYGVIAGGIVIVLYFLFFGGMMALMTLLGFASAASEY